LLVAEAISCSNIKTRSATDKDLPAREVLAMYQYGTQEWDDAYVKIVEQRKESESKPYIVGTPEWVSEFERKIQEDERYKEVAKKWEGSVVLVFKVEPEVGFEDDVFIFMDLWHGDCRSVRLVPSEKGRSGAYVLEAEYGRWKQIMKKELNIVKELATRKVRLVPFEFKKAAKLAAAAQAAIRLVDLSAEVSDKFPDELESDQIATFKALFKELKTNFGI
jgi:putative sterol carrier protein